MAEMKNVIRTVFITYLAIVSLIGLMMIVISSAQLINSGLKTWVFPAADVPTWLEDCTDTSRSIKPVELDYEMTEEEIFAECEERRAQQIENHGVEKARDAVNHLALIIVGLPLFLIHFRAFNKERKK